VDGIVLDDGRGLRLGLRRLLRRGGDGGDEENYEDGHFWESHVGTFEVRARYEVD
jgi:hypothetical protein